MDVVGGTARLALSLDRLSPGLVEAWTGPQALRTQVLAEPLPAPDALARAARRLRAELPWAGLEPDREALLDGRLTALECTARLLAGERVPYAERASACFGVRPRLADASAYALAHEALDGLLPGRGPLAARLEAHRAATALPAALVPAFVREAVALLRARTRTAYALPAGEELEVTVAAGQPWGGLSRWLGDGRSAVAVSGDRPLTPGALLALVAHETYPGHHAHRCRASALLGERPEHDLWLVASPESTVAEGLAEHALAGVGLERWGALVTDLCADLGVRHDGELDQEVAAAAAPLARVRQDAALLRDAGTPPEQVEAHLADRGLQGPDRVQRTLAVLGSPRWGAYATAWVEGRALVGRWLAAGPDVTARFARLLDEPLTPALLRAELGQRDVHTTGCACRAVAARVAS